MFGVLQNYLPTVSNDSLTEALGSWTQEPGAVASMALRQKSIGRKALTPIWTEAVNACSFKGADGIAFWRTLTCTSANELGVRIWVFVCMPTARALVHRVRTSAELSDGSCPVRLCVPFAVAVGQMTVSEELMTELQKTRNGKKLAAALVTVLHKYLLDTLEMSDVSELEVKGLPACATEAWPAFKEDKPLPAVYADLLAAWCKPMFESQTELARSVFQDQGEELTEEERWL